LIIFDGLERRVDVLAKERRKEGRKEGRKVKYRR
jgi:hypothetical protein